MNDKMSQAIAAARSGQPQKAQVLLAQILKEDQSNVNAWFLLSHLVEVPEKKTAFLKRVLALDPQHQRAQQALAILEPQEEVVVEEMPEAVGETAVVAHSKQAKEPEPIAVPIPDPVAEPELPIEEQETAYQLEENDASSMAFMEPDTALPPLTNEEPETLLQQAEGDTLPSWLTDNSEDNDVLSPEALAAEALPDFTESVAIEDLPDWLTKTNIDDWTAEKPWEQAEESLEPDIEEELTEQFEEPEPVKSVIEVAAEQQEPDPPPAPPPITRPNPKPANNNRLNIILTALIIIAVIVLFWLFYIVITSFS